MRICLLIRKVRYYFQRIQICMNSTSVNFMKSCHSYWLMPAESSINNEMKTEKLGKSFYLYLKDILIEIWLNYENLCRSNFCKANICKIARLSHVKLYFLVFNKKEYICSGASINFNTWPIFFARQWSVSTEMYNLFFLAWNPHPHCQKKIFRDHREPRRGPLFDSKPIYSILELTISIK